MKKLFCGMVMLGICLCIAALALLLIWMSGTSQGGVIGGADTPTLAFFFFHKGGGVCSYLTLAGLAMFLDAIVLKIFGKRSAWLLQKSRKSAIIPMNSYERM